MSAFEPLTYRQLQMLEGIRNGMTTVQMAKVFQLTESTIKTHVHQLYQKMGANCAAHAVDIGYRTGWLRMPYPLPLPQKPLHHCAQPPRKTRKEPVDDAE